jgi:hypothetical protein
MIEIHISKAIDVQIAHKNSTKIYQIFVRVSISSIWWVKFEILKSIASYIKIILKEFSSLQTLK